MTEPASAQELFRGRHFDQEIIVLCVRWYLTFKLSSRDLVQMMAERGIGLAHTTILRWVQRYVPDFEKRWNQYAGAVGDSWRVDETYIKVKGQWVYLYRAVDKQGRTVDFLLSQRRDVATAKRFFSHARRQHGAPRVITLDGYAASHRAVAQLKQVGTLPRRVRIRSSQYLESGRFRGVTPLSWPALEGGNPDTSAGRYSPTLRRAPEFVSAGEDVLHAGSIPSVVSSPSVCSRLD